MKRPRAALSLQNAFLGRDGSTVEYVIHSLSLLLPLVSFQITPWTLTTTTMHSDAFDVIPYEVRPSSSLQTAH